MRNMVTKVLNKGLLLIAALLVFSACVKPFELNLPLAVDSHEYTLSSKAGEARIFFYTTNQWTITFEPEDCTWATLNRTSGNGSEPVEEILFTYDENADPDRQVVLLIKAGGLEERITMFQTGIVKEWWDGSTSIDDLIVKPQY